MKKFAVVVNTKKYTIEGARIWTKKYLTTNLDDVEFFTADRSDDALTKYRPCIERLNIYAPPIEHIVSYKDDKNKDEANALALTLAVDRKTSLEFFIVIPADEVEELKKLHRDAILHVC